MGDEVGRDTVGIHPREGGMVALGYGNNAEDKRQEQQQDSHTADKALFLTDGAEDEVGVLFGNVLEFGLGAFEEPFSRDASATDGDFALIDVVARASKVLLDAQGDLDACLLVVLILMKPL